MNIILTGNIASGKSTVLKRLESLRLKTLSLDTARIEAYRKGLDGFELERTAERIFIDQISPGTSYIYESTGSTLFYRRILTEYFPGWKDLRVHIQVEPELCIERFHCRKENHFQVAPPYNGLKVEQSINNNAAKYRMMQFDLVINNSGSLNSLYQQCDNVVDLWQQGLK